MSEPQEKHSTKDRLVYVARDLFLQKGYEATGVAEILKQAEVNSGSLYYFFKTKQDLLLAVLDWYFANLYAEVLDPVFSRIHDPIERVFGVLEGYRQMLTITECRMGCPIGNLALEMSEKSEQVRVKIAQNFENWRVVIRKCLGDAQHRFPHDVDPDKLATFVLTVMEGAVMLARAYRSLKPFDDSIAQIHDYFDRLSTRKAGPATHGTDPRGTA